MGLNNLQCKKENHQQLEYTFLNFSSEKEEDLLYCQICMAYEQYKQNNGGQQYKNIFVLDQIKNSITNQNSIPGWPPIQDNRSEKRYQKLKMLKKEFGTDQDSILKFLKEKIELFFNNLKQNIDEELQSQKKKIFLYIEEYCHENFQSQNQYDEVNNFEQLISNFDINNLREQIYQFENNFININQFWEFQQQQNQEIYNNPAVFSSLDSYFNKFKTINSYLKEKITEIQDQILPLQSKKIKLDIDSISQEQKKLKLYKSQFYYSLNQGNFEVDNEMRTLKFMHDQWQFIYSDILKKNKKYHLKFKIDFKNNVKNQFLTFSLTSDRHKDSKNLETDNSVRIFNGQGNSGENGGDFLQEGKQFYEFFKDNQTIINLVFNISEQYMEFYDNQKIAYQKLTLETDEIQDWVLGIRYGNDQNQEYPVIIEFLE
ncbi:hypothetical protein PPERSA_01836 [Pseudocohnilembus persalinus]|uniref:Uncharacterized protein n=1 Tax=Pseudocohnilembus persalinus TaxID=266149 RepID=A0A0V0QKD2_PSEPJ|nr:hypothetical protein PPERSA_01836 [Pseudocohnilembus persalinus]|eukprot:KRX02719.1 hypothetical protein PPERSA_01836 [Pseudocohnilembus persalinus]